MQNILETERAKGEKTCQEMLAYLIAHPDRHTPFMERWFELCVEHRTQVYPAKPEGAAAGRRLLYGKPARLVECIESANPLGKPGIWFVKLCEAK